LVFINVKVAHFHLSAEARDPLTRALESGYAIRGESSNVSFGVGSGGVYDRRD
jgi:hypothetical protein